LRYLREKGAQVEELAARIGAVNTILIDGKACPPRHQHRLRRHPRQHHHAALQCNRKPTCAGMNRRFRRRRHRPHGCGGAGRLRGECGRSLTARRIRRAALADEFGASARPMETLAASRCRVYVNTTSVGMHPNVAESVFRRAAAEAPGQ
jgi:3-dehydroquinate dehydratase / shikimate dehydrogenase